jgi:hypothetical protein
MQVVVAVVAGSALQMEVLAVLAAVVPVAVLEVQQEQLEQQIQAAAVVQAL